MSEENGRSAILLPHGVLFRSDEAEIRKNLIESDVVECVIALGHYLFFNSAMISCVMICKKHKEAERKGKILFIDAENEVTRKNAQSYLEPKHINRIVGTYRNFVAEPGYSGIADIEKIKKEGYKLSVSLYVEGVKDDEFDSMETIEEWDNSSKSLFEQMNRLKSYFE